jgi:phospholipid/cholesterol/gamma-HCH transport system substrate-binding protein
MRPSPTRDLVVGLFVLAGLGAVAYLSLQVGGLSYKGPGGLTLTAAFDQIGGLKARSPVVISGVKVGQVTRIDLDDGLRARVTLEVDRRLKLPVDTSAAIRTAGLLGDQFVALEPGAEDELLKSGDPIDRTENAISVEGLISKFVTDGGPESGAQSGGGGGK